MLSICSCGFPFILKLCTLTKHVGVAVWLAPFAPLLLYAALLLLLRAARNGAQDAARCRRVWMVHVDGAATGY